MSKTALKGTFPVLTSGNSNLFASHWRFRVGDVTTETNEVYKTGYLAVDQGSFNLYDLCERTTPAKGVYIDALLYVDENDMAFEHLVQPHDPCVGKEFHVVTKILGKRWGIKLTIDQDSGVVTVKGDFESPVIGVKLRLA